MTPPLALGVRLARREFVRRPWRSALVVLMVLIPTAGMTVVTSYVRTGEWSEAQRTEATFGQADAYAYAPVPNSPSMIDGQFPSFGLAGEDDIDRLRISLPAGSQVLVERSISDRARHGDRRSFIRLSDLRLDHPLVEGRFNELRGRAAATGDEVVVTESLARRLDVEIGGVLRPQRQDRDLRIVGTVRMRASNDDVAYVGGGPMQPSTGLGEQVSTFALVDLPDAFASRLEGSAAALDDRTLAPGSGWALRPVSQARASSEDFGVFWAYLSGGVGLVVLGTIIAAAFAVGARGQLRTIGLLSSSGASPAVLRWFLAAQGAVSGLVGSAVGIAVGVIGARLTPDSVLTSMAGRPVDTATIRLVDLVPVLLLGVSAAAVAAWLPARTLSGISTLQALAGRPPLGRVRGRQPARGAALIVIGCGLFALAVLAAAGGAGPAAVSGGRDLTGLIAVAGAISVLVGTVAIAPWVIAAIERASAGCPQAWRLAGRSLARNRARSSAVVGAICAISATVIAGTTLFNSHDARSRGADEIPYLRTNQLLLSSHEFSAPPSPALAKLQSRESVLAEVKRIVPKARFVELHWVTSAGGSDPLEKDVYGSTSAPDGRGPSTVLGLATPELLDALDVPLRLRAALDRGEAVAVTASASTALRAQLTLPDRAGTVDVPLAGGVRTEQLPGALPNVLLGPVGLQRFGFGSRPAGLDLVQLPSPPTGAQRRAIERISGELDWEQNLAGAAGRSIYLQLPSDTESLSPTRVKAGLLGLALLLVMTIVAVGLGLAARDTAGENQVLAAVGASPPLLRRVGALRAFLLASTAVIIAVPAALLPSAAIVAAVNADPFRDYPFRPDVWALLFVVILVPMTVGVVALAGARLRDVFRRPRPETFAFAD